jgi:exopolysaccharide biosynthesis polyprenyl glycosylphosphotransferase
MLGRKQEINMQLTELTDSAILAFSLWFGHFLRARLALMFFPEWDAVPAFGEFVWIMAVVVPFGPIILEARGFYSNLLNKTTGKSLRQLVEGGVIIATIVGMMSVFLRWQVESRAVVVLAALVGGGLLLLREAAQRQRIHRRLASGVGREPVLLVGANGDMDALLDRISDEHRAEIDIVGRIDIMQQPISALVEAMHQHSVGRVLFAAQHVHFSKIEEAVQACETEGVEAWIAADFFQTAIARPTFDVLGGRMMLVFHSTPQISYALWFKDILDRIIALALLVVSLPVWLFAIIGIRLSSPGPIFFLQKRSGRHGKPFMMWKFRSMHTDAEAQQAQLTAQNQMDGPVFKIKNDPRVFGFGNLLRRLSIDELPQLINVIQGDMSLVGPRPLPVYEINRIEKHAQRRRLSVKPGLTCLWQISGRNGITNFEDWVALDLKYIDNWSLWLDMKILLQTVPAVLRGSGAH